MFPDNKASYETATMEKLKLFPANDRLLELKRDYAMMQEMVMGDGPDFDSVMDRLSELEKQIHISC